VTEAAAPGRPKLRAPVDEKSYQDSATTVIAEYQAETRAGGGPK
jgi:hypothetical protein